MTLGSLFAGIGGFDLAATRVGWDVRWQVEIDPFARAVLEKHWPHVHRPADVRKVHQYHGQDCGPCADCIWPVDVLCGGFPCQDLSSAGKRKGLDGERSGLWRQFMRVIDQLQPKPRAIWNGGVKPVIGLDLIAEEQARQVMKWSQDHDDRHDDGALAVAAAALAIDSADCMALDGDEFAVVHIPEPDAQWVGPLVRKHRGDGLRQLVVAGALIASEIDRLLRAKSKDSRCVIQPLFVELSAQAMRDALRQFTRLTACIEAGLAFDQASSTFVLDGQHYDTVTDALRVFQPRAQAEPSRG